MKQEFKVCKNHQMTHGYESCCECGPDKNDVCTEALFEIENYSPARVNEFLSQDKITSKTTNFYEKKNKVKKS